jgi:small subunit ribosomal protein S7
MSRKKRAPKKIFYPDAKYGSLTVAKFINFVMYDGKKTAAEKIIYEAFDNIKSKTKSDPLKVFTDAINNIRPNLEVMSRRVGGATYQVPVEVKSKRSETLALRWLLEASRKRKNKTMSEKLFNEVMDASQRKGAAIKKREDTHKMAESNKAFAHYRW